jgi:2'-5' RNA ligase
MKKLAGAIDNVLYNIGFKKEQREFKGHLTLGRVKGAQNKEKLLAIIKELEGVKLGSFKVNEIVLIASELTPEGPKYSVVKKFSLK